MGKIDSIKTIVGDCLFWLFIFLVVIPLWVYICIVIVSTVMNYYEWVGKLAKLYLHFIE